MPARQLRPVAAIPGRCRVPARCWVRIVHIEHDRRSGGRGRSAEHGELVALGVGQHQSGPPTRLSTWRAPMSTRRSTSASRSSTLRSMKQCGPVLTRDGPGGTTGRAGRRRARRRPRRSSSRTRYPSDLGPPPGQPGRDQPPITTTPRHWIPISLPRVSAPVGRAFGHTVTTGYVRMAGPACQLIARRSTACQTMPVPTPVDHHRTPSRPWTLATSMATRSVFPVVRSYRLSPVRPAPRSVISGT